MTAPLLPVPGASVPGASAAHPAAGQDRAQVRKVARQFEAIFIRQMLSEARKTSLDDSNDGQGLFSSQATDTFREQQDSRFADIAAEKGSFGLGRMIEKQLLARSTSSAGAAK